MVVSVIAFPVSKYFYPALEKKIEDLTRVLMFY